MSRALMRASGPVMVVAAGTAFWLLTHGGVSSSIAMLGYAEAIDHPIAPMAAGKVASVKVKVGQLVKAGEPLVVMEERDLQIKVDAAKAALDQAKSMLPAVEVSQREAVARAELLVLRLKMAQKQGRAQLAEVNQQLERIQKLAKLQLVQAQEVEQRRLKQATLVANLSEIDAAEKQGYAGMGKLASQGGTGGQVAARIEPYRDAVRVAEVALKAAELALEQATIRSPVDGTVSLILHWPGDVVTAGIEVVRVANGRPGHVLFWVPERNAGGIEPGHVAEVRRPGLFHPTMAAKVVEVSPEIEEVPLRARPSPSAPSWARRVVLECSPDKPFVLGEALHVRL